MPNSLPLVWITGAAGLIGNYLVRTAPQLAPEWRVHALKRSDLDLTAYSKIVALFEQEQPNAIIHCAALSKSPDCQANPALARKLNVEATAQLAELAADATLVFFSSDLIFDGQ